MGNRRQGTSMNPFGQPSADLYEVDGALYSGLTELDENRVVIMPVDLHTILVDQAIQVRVAGLDQEVVKQYAEILLNGGEFDDPVILCRDEDSAHFWLADGFHRIAAYVTAAKIAPERGLDSQQFQSVKSEVHPGGKNAAFKLAEEANITHGLRLTNDDKYNIMKRQSMRNDEWIRKSNTQIAGIFGVDPSTIGRWRTRVYQDIQAVDPTIADAIVNTERVGADGRVMDTSRIGRTSELTEDQKKAQSAVRALEKALKLLQALGVTGKDAAPLNEWVGWIRERWELNSQ